jgi:hypothetical protein
MYKDIAEIFFYGFYILFIILFIIPYTRKNYMIKSTYLEQQLSSINNKNFVGKISTIILVIIIYLLSSLVISLVLGAVFPLVILSIVYFLFHYIINP